MDWKPPKDGKFLPDGWRQSGGESVPVRFVGLRLRTWGILIGLIFAAGIVGAFTGGFGDQVPWDDYDPSVRRRINSLANQGDCAGLQNEFDVAEANNAATRRRTGHNNADLMRYIHDKMRNAGCYD